MKGPEMPYTAVTDTFVTDEIRQLSTSYPQGEKKSELQNSSPFLLGLI